MFGGLAVDGENRCNVDEETMITEEFCPHEVYLDSAITKQQLAAMSLVLEGP